MAKSICIVGAGPSGIIAAKTLLHNHPSGTFKVTVFEQSERIGGLWPLSPTDSGMVNPDMCTNLSRHTVSFSDMAWPESSPTFPKAWQAGQYLKNYVERYSGIDIQTSSKVLKASQSASTPLSSIKGWKVEVEKRASGQSIQNSISGTCAASEPTETHINAQGSIQNESGEPSIESHYFDYLIIASGFFGKPKFPRASPSPKSFTAPVQHSTEFRDVETLLHGPEGTPENQGTKILVVGGSISGAEVAASIAIQLSSHVHSPTGSPFKDVSKYRVHHVVRRPFWTLPLFLPAAPMFEADAGSPKNFNSAPTFLPIDLVLYNLGKRPPGQIKNNSGHISREHALRTNEYLRSMIGTDQNDLVSYATGGEENPLAMGGHILEKAPWIAISDTYSEFVRSGQIITTSGSLTRFNDDSHSKSASVTIESNSEERILDDIAAIVLATGFEATASLDFLPPDVLHTLAYDPNYPPFPLALDMHSTTHHAIPSLGFIGFYRGPFWGISEMQARFLGALWTDDPAATTALPSFASPIPALRECYRDTPEQLAQFPMGDYVYLMESFREVLGLESAGAPRGGPVLPARYDGASGGEEAQSERRVALAMVKAVQEEAVRGYKFVARAVFRALQGDWKLQRSLVSSIAMYPSGTFRGTARLFPRKPDGGFDAEYLYFEEGDFETETGLRFRANRRYAHRYSGATDKMSVWFIKADNKTVDYLFHELEILPPVGGSGWRAKASHLCIDDTYDVEYEFRFRGAMIEEWRLSYGVKGPSKDYRIASVYQR